MNFGDVLTVKLEQQFNNCSLISAADEASPSQDVCCFSAPDRMDWSDFIMAVVFLFHPLSSLFIP